MCEDCVCQSVNNNVKTVCSSVCGYQCVKSVCSSVCEYQCVKTVCSSVCEHRREGCVHKCVSISVRTVCWNISVKIVC